MYASDDTCAEAKVQKQTKPDQGQQGPRVGSAVGYPTQEENGRGRKKQTERQGPS